MHRILTAMFRQQHASNAQIKTLVRTPLSVMLQVESAEIVSRTRTVLQRVPRLHTATWQQIVVQDAELMPIAVVFLSVALQKNASLVVTEMTNARIPIRFVTAMSISVFRWV